MFSISAVKSLTRWRSHSSWVPAVLAGGALCGAALLAVVSTTHVHSLNVGAAALLLLVGLAAGWIAGRAVYSDERAKQRHAAEIEAQNTRFEMALKNMSQGINVFDGKKNLVVCNDRYLAMYGLTREQVKPGMSVHALLELRIANGMHGGPSPESFLRERRAAMSWDTPRHAIFELPDGRIIRVSHQPITGGGWVSTHEDVSERERLNARLAEQIELLRHSEEALKARNEQIDAALTNMSQGLCMLDADERLVVCNERFISMYRLSPALAEPGTPLSHILYDHHSKRLFRDAGEINYGGAALGDGAPDSPARSVHELADGRIVVIARQPMANGGAVITHDDITQQRRFEAHIAHMALHDALTGLPNRLLLQQRMEQIVGQGAEASALCLDLDRFKEVNDTLGHAAGDELLKAVAGRLSSCVRDGDLVARVSGDEFVIVQITNDPARESASLAKRAIEALSAPFTVQDHQVVIGCSIGIAVSPGDGGDPHMLLKNADLALYRSKEEGRGTYSFFEPGMNDRLEVRFQLERDLRRALANREFELHFQPLVNLERNAVSGFEALLRWCHPERGIVMPGEFIPLAEETGLIVPIGDWVLRQACNDAAGWPAHVGVSVNLSPMQFRSRALVETVISALAQSGLAPQRLELEITETALLQDNETTLAVLRKLHDLGVRIALDDFGTGYSSLSYLRSFPFDKIKIDRCFISDLTGAREDARAIVRAVARLGGALGMATTAEGVETSEQLDQVREEGCTEIQGYIFSAPRPATEIAQLFFAGHAAKSAPSVAA